MEFNKRETAWLLRLEKCLAAAPASLGRKVSSYTIGDNAITLYDHEKLEQWQDLNPHKADRMDVGPMVTEAKAELDIFVFPFSVESTSG